MRTKELPAITGKVGHELLSSASECCVLLISRTFLQIHFSVGHSNLSHQLIADSITATTRQQNVSMLQIHCCMIYSFLSFDFNGFLSFDFNGSSGEFLLVEDNQIE
jgi:hypothetical protein